MSEPAPGTWFTASRVVACTLRYIYIYMIDFAMGVLFFSGPKTAVDEINVQAATV
jgi:hypothetical protein